MGAAYGGKSACFWLTASGWLDPGETGLPSAHVGLGRMQVGGYRPQFRPHPSAHSLEWTEVMLYMS